MVGKLQIFAIRIAQSAAYAAAYWIAWRLSTDQFFLPAALRVATLLYIPKRAWPSIFVADAVALMVLRTPIAQELGASPTWPYISALLLAPSVALAPLVLMRRWPDLEHNERWWPFAMFAMAAWGACASTAINYLFGGPTETDIVGYLYRFTLGQYLALMVTLLPVLLWRRRSDHQARPSHLLRDSMIAAIGLAILCTIITYMHADATKLTALALMLLPPIFLTVLHGWRGAIIGFVGAALAIQYNLEDTGSLGAKDMLVIVAQQVLAVIGTALIAAGAAISSEFDRSVKFGIVKLHALYLAQSNHLSVEEGLRRRADQMSRSQAEINSSLRRVAQRLRAEGHYALAMEINSQGLTNAKLVYDHASAIYPYQLEHEGLLEFLSSDEFPATVSDNAVQTVTTGCIDGHTVTLQLVCYRLICDAVDMLPTASQLRVRVRASSSNRARRRMIAGVISVRRTEQLPDPRTARIAEKQFVAKIRAYGGTYRRRCGAIIFALTESQSLFAGTTIHFDTPLAPLITLTTPISEE